MDKIFIHHSDLTMLPFFVPLQSVDGQQDLLVFSMVTNFPLTIFSLRCVTTSPLGLGWGVVHGTEWGC